MRLHCLLPVLFFLLLGLAARADTEVENYMFNDSTQNGNGLQPSVYTTYFSEFDTSLGTLTGVNIDLSGTAIGDDVGGAFGGVGAGANNIPMVFGTGSGSGPYPIAADGPLRGGTNFFVDFEGTGSMNLILLFNNTYSASGSGSVTYTYTPVAAETPEPSTMALLGTGIAGMAGVARRRAAFRKPTQG